MDSGAIPALVKLLSSAAGGTQFQAARAIECICIEIVSAGPAIHFYRMTSLQQGVIE
jgi:hypothetical protein